ncbi:uncharacterized protein NEMAJ01_1027 [Nematocida major]|uniref:uncharacterized protein n=1 Tax=Nematocida major TaxID=1912982 RepID=UPI0020089112|nr:uncharacterized protein NEMAJ01_1027 [Nematocida major]KAH9386131.1 hypothetical protein NEMAJ01_1027 [Nematocida major]
MENTQHINIDLDELKHEVLKGTKEIPSTLSSTDEVLKALSFRINIALKNIPAERRAEVEALVRTFLQETLKPVFNTIISAHCVITPEMLDILTREVMAETSSEFSQELSILNVEIDTFVVNHEIACIKSSQGILAAIIESYTRLKDLYEMLISHSEKVLQAKTMEKFSRSGLELALLSNMTKLQNTSIALQGYSEKEKKAQAMLRKAEEEKKTVRTASSALKLERYRLERAFAKVKSVLSCEENGHNVYFSLKNLMEESSGESIPTQGVENLQSHTVNGGNNSYALDMNKKLHTCRDACDVAAEALESEARKIVQDVRVEFESAFSQGSIPGAMKLIEEVEREMKNLQEPEKTEMKKFRNDLREFTSEAEAHVQPSLVRLRELDQCINESCSLKKSSDAYASVKTPFFNVGLVRVQGKFLDPRKKTEYEKELQSLLDLANSKCKTINGIRQNMHAMDRCFQVMIRRNAGETEEDWRIRIAEYEKFAEKNTLPDFSGSIEELLSDNMDYAITLREVKIVLLSTNEAKARYIKELEATPSHTFMEFWLKSRIAETDEKIQGIEQKLSELRGLSEEQHRENECHRYTYLYKHISACLKHMGTLKEKVRAEMASLALGIMKRIEETPNNPELSEKVRNMLEEILRTEPQRLLTADFIVQNEHFLKEMPKVAEQLDREIVEALKKSPGEGDQAALLRNSMFVSTLAIILMSGYYAHGGNAQC